uniref:lateral signaling target protein 2 homolog n=1 Tax=Erigeron canadensis TaxID=72917 RepID=UPI001CB95ABA|nr:lateral signaling target protein 2 homolog [Erigeron canadensis]
MRCKKHTTDLTSINGVCASCLRDRLLKLIAAQEEAEAATKSSSARPPTSLSPHVTPRRKSDVTTSVSHVPRPSSDNQRFYNSPQIAISTTGCIGTTTSRRNNKKLVKFATFQNLFRSNNNTNSNIPTPSSSSSSSATTRIRNNHNHHNRQRCVRNRGMSPVRLSDDDEEDDDVDDDVSSEYESIDTDTYNSCKQTPMKTIRRGNNNKSVSEMIFCLSPLVRANPNRLWKGRPAVDGNSDVRIPVVPKLAYTKSFCANRSRKLADFGRSDPNR